jgi:surface polysaccharide O-acyltransferase-like enzyme
MQRNQKERESMPEVKSIASKNHSIELVRIIACLLVIMAHCQLGVVENNAIVSGRLAFSTFIADDVPLFLLVTGFFFFGRIKSDSDIIQTFHYKAKSFLSRVYIPTIVYILISIFYRYFTEHLPSIADADWDYLGRFIFKLAPGDHLWYICTYMSFVFFFPMLAFVCQDNPQKNKLRRLLLGIAIGGAVVGDIQYFLRMSMFELDKFLWGYCTIFLILGYELSLFIRKFDGRQNKLFVIGAVTYLLGFFIKFGLQNYMFTEYGYIDNRFRWLQCAPCFVTATGLFIFVYALGSFIKANSISAKFINYIGSCTFAIYLFHFLVINTTTNLQGNIWRKFSYATTFHNAAAYYISYAFAVFGITLLVAIIFKYVVEKPVARVFSGKVQRQA